MCSYNNTEVMTVMTLWWCQLYKRPLHQFLSLSLSLSMSICRHWHDMITCPRSGWLSGKFWSSPARYILTRSHTALIPGHQSCWLSCVRLFNLESTFSHARVSVYLLRGGVHRMCVLAVSLLVRLIGFGFFFGSLCLFFIMLRSVWAAEDELSQV